MFKGPSYQNDYSLCSAYDGALDLPDVPRIDRNTATSDEVAAADEIIKDRAAKLKTARDTGVFPIKQGQKPTTFTFRQVPQSSANWWLGEIERNRWSEVEGYELLFRLAVKSVDNLGAVKLLFEDNAGHRLLTMGALNEIYALDGGSGIGVRVVGELSQVVADRVLRGVSPLS